MAAPATGSVQLCKATSYQKKSRSFGLGGLFSKVGDAFSKKKSKLTAGNIYQLSPQSMIFHLL